MLIIFEEQKQQKIQTFWILLVGIAIQPFPTLMALRMKLTPKNTAKKKQINDQINEVNK